jgi:hypothetical protein
MDISAEKNAIARMQMDAITSRANVCALPAGEAPNARKHACQVDTVSVAIISVPVNTGFPVTMSLGSVPARPALLDLDASIFVHTEDMATIVREPALVE